MTDLKTMDRADQARRHAPRHRTGTRALLAVLGGLLAWSGQARETTIQATNAPPVSATAPLMPEASSESMPLWLEEVRAQRQAWEQRRDAARQAYEERRRATRPHAAAQQDAWEEEVRRRRAARLERMEQERTVFRDLGPEPLPFRGGPPSPWPGLTWAPGSALPPSSTATPAPEDDRDFAPPGWDNHWYFRGY